MMFQEPPADTLNFMIAGFAVILGTIGLYITNIIMRFRKLRQDEALLDEIEAEHA
ncbi:MAG TPA: hypothetical protein VMX56_02125 [Anaerolineales bacterium]|nr:hypothetical protein [Anaerolineales bacterium]